jgi:beta-glucanase (GH16 family)
MMKHMSTIVQLLFILSAFAGCNKNASTEVVLPPPVDSIPALPGWTRVWNDEFEGNNVDLGKWEYEVNGNGGGNNELQYYTARAQNSYIDSGSLVIEARKESYLGKEYTSARMRTKKKGDWTYGRFDIRAKLPYGQGLWPAIWMLPTDGAYGGWPLSGEIDIIELLGQETDKVYGTIHFASGTGNHQQSGGSTTLARGTFAGDYHTFSLVWDTTGFKWYVDGLIYFSTIHKQPFDKRFHILLNVAVGGNWPGNPDAFTTFPQRMYVDYVRVYTKSN